MTNLKPGDFFFGLFEFLAYIVPGMILFATLPEVLRWKAPGFFLILNNSQVTAVGWVVFILVSYIFGHFIHHISALILNPVYNATYYKKKKSKHHAFIIRTEHLIREAMPNRMDLLSSAEAYISCKQPSLLSELEKRAANSKLFRALSILCIYLCFYPQMNLAGVLVLIVLSFLSYLKFVSQRWNQRLLTYEYFAVLNGNPKT